MTFLLLTFLGSGTGRCVGMGVSWFEGDLTFSGDLGIGTGFTLIKWFDSATVSEAFAAIGRVDDLPLGDGGSSGLWLRPRSDCWRGFIGGGRSSVPGSCEAECEMERGGTSDGGG